MKTVGGLKKENLVKNKNGKIVSKKKSHKNKYAKYMAAHKNKFLPVGARGSDDTGSARLVQVVQRL